jgi:predicted amidohydrolase
MVGCVPFLDQLGELEIARAGNNDDSYAARLRTDDLLWRDHWIQRSEEALANLDLSGAHIGVLPELALDDKMLNWWQRTLRGTPRPSHSSLQWILVGTGPLQQNRAGRRAKVEPPPNRAVLLSRSLGQTIMWQDKVEPFSLDDAQIRKWRLDPYLGAGPLTEWKQDNDDRHLLDTTVGRIAIMICEDLNRVFTHGANLAALEPTHILAPIFAPPIHRYHWQEQAAIQFANAVGTAVVIANSQAIRVDDSDDDQQTGTALVVQPDGRGPSRSWAIESSLDDTGGDPAGVVTFTLPRS